MNILWLGFGILIAWYVFGRHQGGFGEAFQEVKGFVTEKYQQPLQPRIVTAIDWVKTHRFVTLVIIVAIVFVYANAIAPALQPSVINLVAGKNVMQDKCGNEVEVWVVPASTGESRIEITPEMMGLTLTVLKPGAPLSCALLVPLSR